MNKKSLLLIFSVAAISQAALAVPYTFKAGEAASAQQVNDNFRSLEDRLTVYDYRDFSRASSITEKVFSTTTSMASNCFPTEIRKYKETPVGDNVEVIMTRHRQIDASTPCRHNVFHYLKTPTERLLLGEENWDIAGTTKTGSFTYDSPVVTRTSSMIKGMSFGTGTGISYADPVPPDFTLYNHVVNYVALGLEDVSVPADNYTACLKISKQEVGAMIVSWFCPGVGEVKRVRRWLNINPLIQNESRTWVLESIK